MVRSPAMQRFEVDDSRGHAQRIGAAAVGLAIVLVAAIVARQSAAAAGQRQDENRGAHHSCPSPVQRPVTGPASLLRRKESFLNGVLSQPITRCPSLIFGADGAACALTAAP